MYYLKNLNNIFNIHYIFIVNHVIDGSNHIQILIHKNIIHLKFIILIYFNANIIHIYNWILVIWSSFNYKI